jgi:Polyketide cyclase / dehydrase and lipid transport
MGTDVAPEKQGHTDVVHAPVGAIIDTLADFAAYPQWQASVTSCEVLDRDEDGRGRRVRMMIDAKIRKIEVIAVHTWDVPNSFSWVMESSSGGLSDFSGRYALVSRADGTTEVTCQVIVDPGFPIPRLLKDAIMRQAFKAALRGLKQRAESVSKA